MKIFTPLIINDTCQLPFKKGLAPNSLFFYRLQLLLRVIYQLWLPQKRFTSSSSIQFFKVPGYSSSTLLVRSKLKITKENNISIKEGQDFLVLHKYKLSQIFLQIISITVHRYLSQFYYFITNLFNSRVQFCVKDPCSILIVFPSVYLFPSMYFDLRNKDNNTKKSLR